MRSTVASKMQGKITEKESEYSADTCTYPRMIYENLFVHTVVGFKPTTFLYLLVLLVYQRMQFSRLGIPNDVQLNSSPFGNS